MIVFREGLRTARSALGTSQPLWCQVYEMCRPSLEEVVACLATVGAELNVSAAPVSFAQVARHYACDLRKCVDFLHTAAAQAPAGVISPDFIAAVLGIECTEPSDSSPSKRRGERL